MGLEIVIRPDQNSEAQLDLASQVEVHERMGETTWYSIRYPEDIRDGDFRWQLDENLRPGAELTIFAGSGDNIACLVKGPVFSQQIHYEHGGQGSWVEARGADRTIIMDREFKSKNWSEMTDGDAVTTILGSYGLEPDVEKTNTRHLEIKHSLVQREPDLRFIRRLARRNGCYFWISCDDRGSETAHFKRPQLDNTTETELSINHEFANLQSLDLNWDVERPTSVVGMQLDLNSKSDIDGKLGKTPQNFLGTENLQRITGDTRSISVAAPGDDAGNMRGRSEGALIEADWFIRATCMTSTYRVGGRIIRTNEIVNLRGFGSRHSGPYYVAGVRHIIDETAHKMELELIRNAWNGSEGGLSGLTSGIF